MVMSVIDPGPWWPSRGMLLILVMSRLVPVAPAASVPVEAVGLCPQARPEM